MSVWAGIVGDLLQMLSLGASMRTFYTNFLLFTPLPIIVRRQKDVVIYHLLQSVSQLERVSFYFERCCAWQTAIISLLIIFILLVSLPLQLLYSFKHFRYKKIYLLLGFFLEYLKQIPSRICIQSGG